MPLSDATGVTQLEADQKNQIGQHPLSNHKPVCRRRRLPGHADMFPACVVAVFYLVSASRSVALRCSDSIRPLDELDPRRLEGIWALVGGSFTDPAAMEFFKRRNSSSIHFSHLRSNNATANFVFTASFHMGGKWEPLWFLQRHL